MFKPTRELPLADQQQINVWRAEAKEFIKSTGYYADMRWDAEFAVAEYIAAKHGFTIRNWTK